ncbi:hypothetical protein Tsubulata_003175 [Turnera subulata]|uniref:CRM domain-containing protein n=1 Tax=Turnera subulata TaxID=218843 RepID=A0A9Q0G0U2_9ROSI|nr:hypothetical protein Tsubulata_003175 [Turnera subulata]
MALKLFPIPFPIFLSPLNTHPNPNPNPFEVRFSKWNNPDGEKFNDRRRGPKEIEDDGGRPTASRNYDSSARPTTTRTSFKSRGTPSSPSGPGKISKYSKPGLDHPAFRKPLKVTRLPKPGPPGQPSDSVDRKARISVGEDGVSYVIDGAPFEFKYSYTETPKVKPVKLQEPPFSPFGPTTTPRPWTGRAPLPASRKKLKEFDSFRLPPPHKKGVKPVQAPGPYRPGTGPRYVKTREEILGEPLTKEEIHELVSGCIKTNRQLNMGRDGFTHNMLDNIHALWKRKRVCKIKCKGVCTVDMDNVCQQLEEKTGGKIIYRKGGVVFLFRGRNYNYKTRPQFPLMLWKPVSPLYPRLIKRVPEGLTLEEATEMRKKGKELKPICKLGKNGVYINLAKDVREAFEVCELVRINCQGLNRSDYRKIGAKLRDLVPCVLISFELEHILMWRGKDWKSCLTKPVNGTEEVKESTTEMPPSEENKIEILLAEDASDSEIETSTYQMDSEEQEQALRIKETDVSCAAMDSSSVSDIIYDRKITPEADNPTSANTESEVVESTFSSEGIQQRTECTNENSASSLVRSNSPLGNAVNTEKLQDAAEAQTSTEPAETSAPYMEDVLKLLNDAVESGSAVVLGNDDLDADIVHQRSIALAQSAPPGPIFIRRPSKIAVKKYKVEESGASKVEEVKEAMTVSKKQKIEKRSYKFQRRKEFQEPMLDAAPKGSLGVDELAKLLA